MNKAVGPEEALGLHPHRLFPADPTVRALAAQLYDEVAALPIISPHGHVPPRWFAENIPFENPAALFVTPDHYVFRILASQGVPLEALGVPRIDGGPIETDPRAVWRLFAQKYHLFRGTPTRLWLDHAFATLFGIDKVLSSATADATYDVIAEALARPEFRPRALFERFNIEALATTEGALEDLRWHDAISASGWTGRVVTTYRPDAVLDPDYECFAANLDTLGALTSENTGSWSGYLAAHAKRRAYFRARGATATDHGFGSARTENLSPVEAAALFDRVRSGHASADERERFRGQMLTEMAKMSVEDGMVMQIHPGAWRNHSPSVFASFGRDAGYDIPQRIDFVGALKPLLDAVGMNPKLTPSSRPG